MSRTRHDDDVDARRVNACPAKEAFETPDVPYQLRFGLRGRIALRPR